MCNKKKERVEVILQKSLELSKERMWFFYVTVPLFGVLVWFIFDYFFLRKGGIMKKLLRKIKKEGLCVE